MKIHTFDRKKWKMVVAGELDLKTREFTKKVNKNHYMVMMKGYGIQEDVIQQLRSYECIKIRIITEKDVFESPLKEWLKKDIKVRDFGHGSQRFLPTHRMEVKHGM